jgi:NTE family protein
MEHTRDAHPKIGVALGSGSARGLAHIGVLKVLEKHNIPVRYVAGASVGAVIGAYYAKDPTIASLEELVYKIAERKFSSIIDLSIKGGILKGLKIENLLHETLEGATFDTLKLPFAAVSTDLINADTVSIHDGDLIKAIRASISIPGFLRPVEYRNRVLADGGLSNPVPVDAVRRLGADIVIAVNLDKLFIKDEILAVPPLAKLPNHSISILRHHLALKSARTAEVTISPLIDSGIIAWRDFFTRSKLDEFIAEGERAAEEQIPHILKAIESYHKPPSRFTRFVSFIRSFPRA